MEKIEEQLKKLSIVKMSEEEKNRLRAGVISVVLDKPIRHIPIRSPWSLRYAPLFTKITAALLAVVLLGGGTLTFASEKALPGDWLYPVKIEVAENIIEGSLIHTPEDVLNWQQKRLSRRINEVKELKKKGAITKKQAAVVKTVVKDHVSQIQTAISTLKEEGKSDVVLASAASLIPIVTSLNTKKDESATETVTAKTDDTAGAPTQEIKSQAKMMATTAVPEDATAKNGASQKGALPPQKEGDQTAVKEDADFTVTAKDAAIEDETENLEADLKIELKKIEVDVKAVADDTANAKDGKSADTKDDAKKVDSTKDTKSSGTPTDTSTSTKDTTPTTPSKDATKDSGILPKSTTPLNIKITH
jgi:hypothetical protein